MKKSFFAPMRMFMMAILAPLFSVSLVSCESSDDAPSVRKAVDLGLSVKWATCNVGAEAPEEYGCYYAWGETAEKEFYTEETYQFKNGENRYQHLGDNISGTEYDAAHVKWGDGWRMPTKEEIEELCNNCSWEWTSVNGVEGYNVSGNGNSIFLPASGYRCDEGKDKEAVYCGVNGFYWSATLREYGQPNYTYTNYLYYNKRSSACKTSYRYYGYTIRPVIE